MRIYTLCSFFTLLILIYSSYQQKAHDVMETDYFVVKIPSKYQNLKDATETSIQKVFPCVDGMLVITIHQYPTF
jgi:hypothetical protein